MNETLCQQKQMSLLYENKHEAIWRLDKADIHFQFLPEIRIFNISRIDHVTAYVKRGKREFSAGRRDRNFIET